MIEQLGMRMTYQNQIKSKSHIMRSLAVVHNHMHGQSWSYIFIPLHF